MTSEADFLLQVLSKFPFPPGWCTFQSPETHRTITRCPRTFGGQIFVTKPLRVWLRDEHINPHFKKTVPKELWWVEKALAQRASEEIRRATGWRRERSTD